MRVLPLLVFAATAIGCGEPAPLRVMTFNVLCSFCDPSYDPWEDRLAFFADTFARQSPDLIGLQEISFEQEVDQIRARSPRYAAIYFDEVLPEDGERHPYPDATIFYDAERFDVLEHGFFWLSPTPDDPFSTGFSEGRQLPRLITWARLRDLDASQELVFASTHFDNNAPSQDRSAPLALERLIPIAGDTPLVFVGDFNSDPSDPAYQTLAGALTNAFDRTTAWRTDSNEDPPPDYDPALRIDHIFLRPSARFLVDDWVADLHVYGENQRPPSDHKAIAASLLWP